MLLLQWHMHARDLRPSELSISLPCIIIAYMQNTQSGPSYPFFLLKRKLASNKWRRGLIGPAIYFWEMGRRVLGSSYYKLTWQSSMAIDQYVSFEEAFALNVNLLHSQFIYFYNNSKTCSFFLATSITPYDTWKCMSFLLFFWNGFNFVSVFRVD